MPDRRNSIQNGRTTDGADNDKTVENILWGLGGLALAGGAIFALTKAFASEEEAKTPPRSQATSSGFRQHQLEAAGSSHSIGSCYIQEIDDESSNKIANQEIIIAVDATATRGGGLLILPGLSHIYFYSIDWSGIIPNFEYQPDKFEMINSLLALKIFEKYVSYYRKEETVLLKTDNTFCTSKTKKVYSGLGNEGWRKVFHVVEDKLHGHPFIGDWSYIDTQKSDDHIKMADKLSKNDCSYSENLPLLTSSKFRFENYFQWNISSGNESYLNEIATLIYMECNVRK